MKKRILIIFILIFFCNWQYGQNIKNKDKIDPAFRLLLSQQKLQNKGKCSSTIKASNAKPNASKNKTSSPKLECIIYTKNPKALKDKGIVINSTLPTFVTAVVTLAQIEQLASMNEVTYIEAPKNNYPNN